MTNTYGFGLVARRVLVLSLGSLALSGCKGHAQPQTPPPPEVSVIEIRPAPVTVYDEYVAQTQAPDTIEIRAQVTGLLLQQAFADGARVRKGDLLYAIDQRPFEAQIAQARANVAQAEANLINARQNLDRNGRLIAQHAVSQQDYDAAAAHEKASTALVEAQKALLRDAEINLEFTTIRAPRDGVMSSSQVKPGALIAAQQTLMTTLYSNDPMWALFTLSEDKLLELQKRLKYPPGERADQAPPFRIRLADGSDYALPGRLNFVNAAIDQKSGTLQVRVSVPNPERLLRPGLFVRVIVPAFEDAQGIRVPQRAIKELQGLKSVYVVTTGDKAEERPVVAKRLVENDWVVESGLSGGERIVVDGIGKVQPGIRQAEQNLVASNADIGVAKAAYFPEISLTGLFGLESAKVSDLFKGASKSWAIGAPLTVPVFTAGRIRSQVEQAEAGQREALHFYRKSIISAFGDFENALVDRAKFEQASEEQVRNVEALQRFYDLAALRYQEGATIYLEVANAEQSLSSARLQLVSTQSQLFQSYANLYRAMGGGWVDAADRLRAVPTAAAP
jgi:membrane fusion protein, multidrug efflux system